jgi:choline kinase
MRERSKDKAKAIILAAGRSTRLRPLTEDIPKCLLSLGDETILDYQIRHLAKLNIERELIVVGYKRDLIVEHIARSEYGIPITIVHNKVFHETDNAYSLSLAFEHIDPETDSILILDGDILFEFGLLRKLVQSPHDNVCIVDNEKKIEPEDCKVLVKNGFAASIGKSVQGNAAYTSMIRLSGPLLSEFTHMLKEPRVKPEWYSEPLNRLLLKHPSAMHVVFTNGLLRCEIDTYDDLLRARTLRKKINARARNA